MLSSSYFYSYFCLCLFLSALILPLCEPEAPPLCVITGAIVASDCSFASPLCCLCLDCLMQKAKVGLILPLLSCFFCLCLLDIVISNLCSFRLCLDCLKQESKGRASGSQIGRQSRHRQKGRGKRIFKKIKN